MRRVTAARTLSAVVALAGLVSAGSVACSLSAEVGAGDGETTGGTVPDPDGGAPRGTAKVGDECKVGNDCESGVCKSSKCAAPSPDDGVKNADETDVDCGGSKAPKCETGKGCAKNEDCSSDACNYAKKCVSYPSCVGQHGGDTCGAGEDCCTTVAVPDGPDGAFEIDKYEATAGRMRVFIEKTKGDLQSWVAQAKPNGWDSSWTSHLPKDMDDALFLLGPGNKRGCDVKNQGGRTYWQPPIGGDPEEKSDFSQEVLDEKSLNCVTWHMAAALCAYDGKRLPSVAEIRWLFKNGQGDSYPWSFQDSSSYDPGEQDERLAHRYNYETPSPPANMRLVGSGPDAYPLDHAFYMAPPGSFPKGVDKFGVMDVAGNMLPWTNGEENEFIWTFSWEQHKGDLKGNVWQFSDGPAGYYAIGVRCAKD